MKRCFTSALLITGLLAPATLRAQTADSTHARPISWTSDRRRFVAGDVITILVDEQTVASADKSNLDSQERSTTTGLGVDVKTGATSPGTKVDAGISSSFGGSSKQRGQASRQDRLTGEISARVVKIEPNGSLRVEGRKSVKIDGHEQTLAISGIVRPQDLSRENVVDSWRLADLQVAYASSPQLGKPKSGILTRIIGIIWP